MSARVHPSRSCDVSPQFTISTYSSGSRRDTTPSKKMHAICTSGVPDAAAIAVGDGVRVGVGCWATDGPGVAVAVAAGVSAAVMGGLQPAATASSSVQNHRSPIDSSITVLA